MKTRKGFLVVSLVSLAMAFSILAYAEDVSVNIVIPEIYVEKLTNMVTDKWLNEPTCEGLTLKDCFIKKMIKESIIEDYTIWERTQAPAEAKVTFDEAREAYKAALRNSETAEVEFDVTGE